MTAADMQGAKSTYGMSSCSHSVWCLCQRGGSHHAYPDYKVSSYDEKIIKYCADIGCAIKTEDQMYGWAHYSPGVGRGGAFTSFTCTCCGYAPSEKQWRADLAEWHKMDDAGQAAAKKKHINVGDDDNSHKQHSPCEMKIAAFPSLFFSPAFLMAGQPKRSARTSMATVSTAPCSTPRARPSADATGRCALASPTPTSRAHSHRSSLVACTSV